MSDLPPPRRSDDPKGGEVIPDRPAYLDPNDKDGGPVELGEVLREVRAAKLQRPVRRRTVVTVAVFSVVAALLFSAVFFGGEAGAWVLLFVGIAALPLAVVGWLALTVWRIWREPDTRDADATGTDVQKPLD
jgi:hypothetical protein